MAAEVWIAGAGLLVTIFIAAGSVIWKLSENKGEILRAIAKQKDDFDAELTAIRQAAFIEYKDLRREVDDKIEKVYREVGEAPKALREHVTQMELWMRDNLLPRKEYERDQDQVLASVKTLSDTIDRRLNTVDKKLDELRKGS